MPQTGVSIGEINRLLHQRFGHDVHIGGDLVLLAGYAALDRGDAAAAVPPLAAFHKAWLADSVARLTYAAAADLAAAAARAPHYADPFKAWGDVLARQGRIKDAVVKYDEALKYAPAWVELRRARDIAVRAIVTRGRKGSTP